MASLLVLFSIIVISVLIFDLYGINITDCNFNLNRLSTFETCYCSESECIFDFNLNSEHTLDVTSFITCDHTEIKLDSPHIFTQCIINCNSINSCNKLQTHINNNSQSTTSFIQCSARKSCDNLGYFCQNRDCIYL